MNLKKRFHRDIEKFSTPDRNKIIGESKSKPISIGKKWLTLPVSAVISLMLIFSVVAGGIIIAHLNFDAITDNNVKLTEVPEGYIGIYTVDDLVKLREDVNNNKNGLNYILMSDITFTDADYAVGGACEGGWTPIESTGNIISVFNGNGHIIRNLQCRADRSGNIGLFADTCLETKIINLGIEDCHFTVNAIQSGRARYEGCSVGAIAGKAQYIGGCYVDGITLDIHVDVNADPHTLSDSDCFYINVGGLAGEASYTDACYAENVNINVVSDGEGEIIRLYAGGIAGSAVSSLTCWTDDSLSIAVEGENYDLKLTDPIATLSAERMIPAIMTEESFNKMMDTVTAKFGFDDSAENNNDKHSFEYKLVAAYYLQYSEEGVSSEVNESNDKQLQRWECINELYRYITQSDATPDKLYVFDPTNVIIDYKRSDNILIDAFGSRDAYLEFCHEYNLRLGQLSCYVFKSEETLSEEDATGFDFEHLWEISDGKPKLKVFN